jgi:hypothetical protein
MTHTDQHTQSPGSPRGRRFQTHSVSLRTIVGSAIAVATVAGAAVLGVLTLAVDDQSEAIGRPLAAEVAGERATQGSIPDRGPVASAALSGRPWEDERFDKCVEAETRSRPMASSDDGLPNPWEAGSIAAKCHLLTDTPGAPSTSTSARVTEASASASPPTATTPTCSISSVPTLDVAPVPQSSLTESVPYTAVCTNDANDEETTFVFLYRHDNHTPAPRR